MASGQKRLAIGGKSQRDNGQVMLECGTRGVPEAPQQDTPPTSSPTATSPLAEIATAWGIAGKERKTRAWPSAVSHKRSVKSRLTVASTELSGEIAKRPDHTLVTPADGSHAVGRVEQADGVVGESNSEGFAIWAESDGADGLRDQAWQRAVTVGLFHIPKSYRAIGAPRYEHPAIGAEGERPDAVRMPAELGGQQALARVPEPYAIVPSPASRQRLPIRSKGHAASGSVQQ